LRQRGRDARKTKLEGKQKAREKIEGGRESKQIQENER
jgi:hypothetical protein